MGKIERRVRKIQKINATFIALLASEFYKQKTAINMKNQLKTAFTLLLVSLIVQLGHSQIVRNYNLSGFQKLNMGSAFVIKVVQGNTFKVISKGKKEDLDKINVFVEKGTLVAESKSKWKLWQNENTSRIEFQIEMPTITAIDFSGATTSFVTGFDDLNNLDIELSGASKSKLDVFANNVTIDVSGASELDLVGRANKMNVSMSGASNIKSTNFPTKSADIDGSGASNIKLSVSESLDIDISGASSVAYLGNPKVHKSSSGGASVRRISK